MRFKLKIVLDLNKWELTVDDDRESNFFAHVNATFEKIGQFYKFFIQQGHANKCENLSLGVFFLLEIIKINAKNWGFFCDFSMTSI